MPPSDAATIDLLAACVQIAVGHQSAATPAFFGL
jgi:hypothetical protein